jgi:hypothetical protein
MIKISIYCLSSSGSRRYGEAVEKPWSTCRDLALKNLWAKIASIFWVIGIAFFLIADFLNPPKSPFFKGGLLKQFR